jgi:hypothetical protein
MVVGAESMTVVRAVSDPVDAVERAILRDAQVMLQRLTRRLDTQVARLVATRLAPIDRAEARRFMADFRRGELV